jgi:hypothetical protein
VLGTCDDELDKQLQMKTSGEMSRTNVTTPAYMIIDDEAGRQDDEIEAAVKEGAKGVEMDQKSAHESVMELPCPRLTKLRTRPR